MPPKKQTDEITTHELQKRINLSEFEKDHPFRIAVERAMELYETKDPIDAILTASKDGKIFMISEMKKIGYLYSENSHGRVSWKIVPPAPAGAIHVDPNDASGSQTPMSDTDPLDQQPITRVQHSETAESSRHHASMVMTRDITLEAYMRQVDLYKQSGDLKDD